MKTEQLHCATSYLPPPKIVWKEFAKESPNFKQTGCYLLWNANTGEGTMRRMHIQSNRIFLGLWATTYTHWALFPKGSKRDHYG